VIQAGNKRNPDQKKEIHAYTTTVLPEDHSNRHSHPGLDPAVNSAGGYAVAFYFL
jgi:hypothetical protein